MLARALEMVDKVIAEHLAGDAPLGSKPLGRVPEVGCELWDIGGRDIRMANRAIG